MGFSERLKKIVNLVKDERGATLLEYVIGLLMFVVFVAFSLDILFVATRYHLMGREVNDIARALSVQSGTTAEVPYGFPGGDDAYLTSSEILNRITKTARAVGFEDHEWELYLEETDANGNVVRSGVLTEKSNFPVDYLNKITVHFRGTYRWSNSAASGIPGIGRERTMSIKRVVMAEYLRNYDE